jgi:aldose 1-epimerase
MNPIVLRRAGATATVDPARGGRLASVLVGGRELLIGPQGADDRSMGWGCYLMAPWPGRLAAGRLLFRGETYQLRRNHGRHAIHGVVFDRPWDAVALGPAEVSLVCSFDPAAWPFGGAVRQTVALDNGGVTLTAEIVAERPMPAALGWHPWFRRVAQDATLRVNADRFLETWQMIPTGEVVPVGGRTDLRRGPRLGSRRLDHAYVGVRGPSTIDWPDRTLTIEHEPPLSVVTVFTRPQAICVEPQTAWPNALGLRDDDSRAAGAVTLRAGESLRATMRVGWEVR